MRKFLQAALGEEALQALEQGLAKEPKLAKAMPQRAVLSWALQALKYSYDGPVPGQDDLWLSLSKSGALLVSDQEQVDLGQDLYKIAAALALTLELEPEPQQLATKAAQRLGKSLDQLVGTRMVRVEAEVIMGLRKAISLIPPGKPSGPDQHNYSHVLAPGLQSKGYELHVHSNPATGGLHAKAYHRGQVVGEVQGSHDGQSLDIQDASVHDQHRGQGLGLHLYEGLMAHAHQLGATHVQGGVHSSSAGKLHQALARKHGLGYNQTPTPFPHLKSPEPGDYDGAHGPYEYALKKEPSPLEKGWPRDEQENQANAAANAVVQDHLMENGRVLAEPGQVAAIPMPKNLNQKASQNRTWRVHSQNLGEGRSGSPHGGDLDVPEPHQGVTSNQSDGGWNRPAIEAKDHPLLTPSGLEYARKNRLIHAQSGDRRYWEDVGDRSDNGAFPIPDLPQGAHGVQRFRYGRDHQGRRAVKVYFIPNGEQDRDYGSWGNWYPDTQEGDWETSSDPMQPEQARELRQHLIQHFTKNPLAKAQPPAPESQVMADQLQEQGFQPTKGFTNKKGLGTNRNQVAIKDPWPQDKKRIAETYPPGYTKGAARYEAGLNLDAATINAQEDNRLQNRNLAVEEVPLQPWTRSEFNPGEVYYTDETARAGAHTNGLRFTASGLTAYSDHSPGVHHPHGSPGYYRTLRASGLTAQEIRAARQEGAIEDARRSGGYPQDLPEDDLETHLQKKTGPVFPKLGFGDDRRETVIADDPRQKEMMSRVQAQSVRNLAKDPEQAQHLGVPLENVNTQQIDQHFRERGHDGRGALGSVAVGPNPGPHAIGPGMRRTQYMSLNPDLQEHNESLNDPNAVRPVQLHENLHGLFGRIANKHGGEARNALTQNLWGWVSYRAPKAAHAVQEALKRFYDFSGQSGKPPFEEFLATTLNLANSKSDRADLNFKLGLDENQARQLHQAFNTVHRHMGEGGKMADERWLSPQGFKKFLMAHARTAAPEHQTRPDQSEPLDFMVGLSPRERQQVAQAAAPPKKHFLDDMPMRKGWPRSEKDNQENATAFLRDNPASEDRLMETGMSGDRQVHDQKNPAAEIVQFDPPGDSTNTHPIWQEKMPEGARRAAFANYDDTATRNFAVGGPNQRGLADPILGDEHRVGGPDWAPTVRHGRAHGAVGSPDRGATPADDLVKPSVEHATESTPNRGYAMSHTVGAPELNAREGRFWERIGKIADRAAQTRGRVANRQASVKVQKIPKDVASKMQKGWPKDEKQNQENKAGFIRESPPTEDRLMEQGLSTKTQHGTQLSSMGEARFPSGKPAAFIASGLGPEYGEPPPMFDLAGTGDSVGAYQSRSRRAHELAVQNQEINNRQNRGLDPDMQVAASRHGNVYERKRGATPEEDAILVAGNGTDWVEGYGLAMRQGRLEAQENSFWALLGQNADRAATKRRVSNGRATVKVNKLPREISEKMNKAWPKDEAENQANAAAHQVLGDALQERGAVEISPQDATQQARNTAAKVGDEIWQDSRRGRRMQEAQDANARQDHDVPLGTMTSPQWDEPNDRRAPGAPFTPKPTAQSGPLQVDNHEADVQEDASFWQRIGRAVGLQKAWPKNDQENQANAAAGAVAEDSMLEQGAKREEFGPDRDLLWEGLNSKEIQGGGRKMLQVGPMGVEPSDEAAMNRHALVSAANETGEYGYPGRGSLPYGDIGSGPNPTAMGSGLPFNGRDATHNALDPHGVVYFPEDEISSHSNARQERREMQEGYTLGPELEQPMQDAVTRADQILAPPPRPKAKAGLPEADPKAWAKLKAKLGKKVKKVELPGQTHQPEKQNEPLAPQAPEFQPQNGIQLQAQRKKPTQG